MAHSVWCELVCRSCAVTIAGQWAMGAIPRRSLMNTARDYGALFEDEETFCSQSCLDTYHREKTRGEPADG
jgi:hypothetical protein